MARTIRHKKDYTYKDKDSLPKAKDKKFFGYPEDSWARGGGRHGKKRSYGHFAGMAADYPKHIRNKKKNPPPPLDDEDFS